MAKKSNKKLYLKSTIAALIVFVSGFLIGSVDTSEDCAAVQANTIATDSPTITKTVDTAEQTQTTIAEEPKEEQQEEIKNVDILDSTKTAYLGSENAPITMVEFTDYECPFCQRYFFGAFKDILEKYVKTGKVKYVMKSLPLSFHSEARPAAYAVYCADEQSARWAMHKRLFMYQNDWAYSDDTSEKFTEYAREIGLNINTFASCLETAPKKYNDQIDEDIAFGLKYKITGTPSFIINGQTVVGAQKFETFAKIIDSAL